MQLTGMLHGARLLKIVGFPSAEVLGPDASEEQVKALIDRHGQVFVKPVFKGGVGKKGKAGLLGRAKDVATAFAEKERLFFVEHQVGNVKAKANGVTFEGGVPSEHEIYFSLTDSTEYPCVLRFDRFSAAAFPSSVNVIRRLLLLSLFSHSKTITPSFALATVSPRS